MRFSSRAGYLALAISILALIMAGSFTAYAATTLQKNQVTSFHIKNGTVAPADLSAESKAGFTGPQGERGPKGDTGERGPAGESITGPQGPQGPAGKDGAGPMFFASSSGGSLTDVSTSLVERNVPAGFYLINATWTFRMGGNDSAGECTLTTPNPLGGSVTFAGPAGLKAGSSTTNYVNFVSAGTVAVKCSRTGTTGVTVSDLRLSLTRVTSVN